MTMILSKADFHDVRADVVMTSSTD